MRYVFSGWITFFMFLFCFIASTDADVVYLKNGRSMEGIVKSKDEEGIKLEMNLGTVGIRFTEIDRIEYSSSEQYWQLRSKWEQEKQARQAVEEQEKADQENTQKTTVTGLTRPKEVDVSQEGNHIFVEAVLNKEVKAQLCVDTGASIVILSNGMAKKLGIDMSNLKKTDIIPLQMGDGRKVEARYVSLKTVSIEGVEAKGVDAAILPDSKDQTNFQDGLLGMSFLRRFNFRIDSNNKKLVLEPLK
jgi:clan AA aspartic protease (TIGR02281 family)